ncbi:hypothetical protein ACIBK8_33745 [Streptomyces sp. NPDC050161]|uniref:hypothetical protein n=1 Tax=Streptomyces sp. NPDC050161 TaxID=3365604 RepID=UPI003799E37D
MGEQYRVDLSALEDTIRKLNSVLKDLGNANADTRYKTSLSANALGADAPGASFLEARKLTEAHSKMKAHIEEVVQHLHDVTDQFGTNTRKVHGNYQNQEAETATSMSGD